jgi:hypothetical protein
VVVTFGERPDASHAGVTSDTRLSESEPTYNTGANVSIGPDASPKRVLLVRFDLTALPVDTIVESANLLLFTRACSGCEAVPGTSVQVYRLLEDWVEGTSVSAAGVANYTYRTATELWTTPGAGPGSRDTVSLASFSPQTLDTEYVIMLPVNIVRAWVADPASNFGLEFAIEGQISDGVSFNSSESEFPEKRPLLVLTIY